jgi:hypothetical protein
VSGKTCRSFNAQSHEVVPLGVKVVGILEFSVILRRFVDQPDAEEPRSFLRIDILADRVPAAPGGRLEVLRLVESMDV